MERLRKEEIVPKSLAHMKYLRFNKKISYPEFELLKSWNDVLGLPDHVPKPPKREVDVQALISEKKIKSFKHAKYLRSQDQLSYLEYQQIAQAVDEHGDNVFVITA